MSFKDSVSGLADRLAKAKSQADISEEATKQAVILPFLKELGFDVFDTTEVIPEYTADVGIRRGEKVDYAVAINGKIEFIVEAKPLNANLGSVQYNQLYRYFGVTEVRIAILTNGADYWFFTDIDAPNKMDERPFFKFSLEAYDDGDLRELEKFSKSAFNIDLVQETAAGLKYSRLAGAYITEQIQSPDDEFVKLVGRSFYEGNLTAKVVEALKPNIRRAFDDIIRQRVRQRLEVALGDDDGDEQDEQDELASAALVPAKGGVQTTDEEWQAFFIIQAIAAEVTSPSNITIRDAKAYCAVLFGDNNRKPICRLFLEGKTKSISFFDAEKNEERVHVGGPGDLYQHQARIKNVVAHYSDAMGGN
ncbi:type I restriction endonuclease [Maricaulis sp.]|uniref:type I restriction endonuclease n=1 Tax=Maricaulis sp. TaxID=1486257 RepID=UPI002B273134|nr:type I restriction endonuclease [Maricaulis sp.]